MTFNDYLFTTNLWDLADYTNGRPTKPSELVKQGIPIIKIAELSRGITAQTNMVSRHVVDPKHIVRAGDLLFAWSGTIGIHTYDGPEAALNQHIFKVVAKDFIDQVYLRYLLEEQLKVLQGFVEEKKTTMGHVTIANLKTVEVSIPKDLNKQRRIASYIESLDNLLNVEEKKGKTLEVIAQTIFKSWFIDFDPVKAKMAGEKPAGMDAATAALFPDSMEESELGIVPSGWKVTKLSSSLKLHKSTVKAGASTESVPYVPVDQIGAKDIFLKNSMPGSAAKTSLVSFRKNDILFGAMRPYFHKVVLAPFDGTTRTTTFVLRVINSNYLSHSLFTVNQENAVAFATNNSQGTTIPYAVWNNSFEDFPMVLPTEPTAKAFNDLVLPIIEYGYSLIAQNRSLVEIRNGLLPRLISGELQIPDEMLAS